MKHFSARKNSKQLGSRDTATPSQEHLTILSLLLREQHESAVELLQGQTVQTNAFARFIERHNLQLLLFSLLDGSPVRRLLGQEWLHELKRFCLSHWARQEMLVRELVQISTAFTTAGQEFILLKGAYLATRFFGKIDRRPFFDLDLLIHRNRLPEAERLLKTRGYVRKSSVLFNEALTTYFTHAFDFAKSNVALDLHWALSANAAHRLDYNAIWRQRQNFVLNNQNFSVLSDEYEIVFSLISIFKDLAARGESRA